MAVFVIPSWGGSRFESGAFTGGAVAACLLVAPEFRDLWKRGKRMVSEVLKRKRYASSGLPGGCWCNGQHVPWLGITSNDGGRP